MRSLLCLRKQDVSDPRCWGWRRHASCVVQPVGSMTRRRDADIVGASPGSDGVALRPALCGSVVFHLAQTNGSGQGEVEWRLLTSARKMGSRSL